MNLVLQRKPTTDEWTFGDLYIERAEGRLEWFCYTLEDELREHKIPSETAIWRGRYQVELEDSPKFGPDTVTLRRVPNFEHIRIHSGNSDEDTAGCIIVGDSINEKTGRISGGTNHGILNTLKWILKRELDQRAEVWITIRNAPGDRFVDTGALASEAVT